MTGPRSRRGNRQTAISKEMLTAYKIVVEEHGHIYPTVAGVLLFGKKPQSFSAESFIICTHFRGVSGREALATTDCQGTLFDQYRAAYDFVVSRLYHAFVIRGPKRKERLEIPENALREVLINALVHRNYHVSGPTKVAIYDDRVEIFSPGSFPGPLDVNHLTLGITYIRNRAISRVFREAGYVEKLGSGFITLFESYQEYGLEKPRVVEGPNFVKCILPRTAGREGAQPVKKDGILLLLGAVESITIGDVMGCEKVSRSTARRRLDGLIQGGLIKRVGQGRNTRYVGVSSPKNA